MILHNTRVNSTCSSASTVLLLWAVLILYPVNMGAEISETGLDCRYSMRCESPKLTRHTPFLLSSCRLRTSSHASKMNLKVCLSERSRASCPRFPALLQVYWEGWESLLKLVCYLIELKCGGGGSLAFAIIQCVCENTVQFNCCS